MSCDQTGKSSLDAGRSYGEQKRLKRKSELKQTDPLRTNRMRQEYPIKEAYNTASKSGTGKKKGAPEKSFFRHEKYLVLFCQYMRKTSLTEQMYSVKVSLEINPTKTLGIKEVSG